MGVRLWEDGAEDSNTGGAMAIYLWQCHGGAVSTSPDLRAVGSTVPQTLRKKHYHGGYLDL